jgi:hypothetical protein
MSSGPAAGGSVGDVFRRTILSLVTLTAAIAVLAGCGFVKAADVSARKPDGFVLRGHVSVPVPAGDSRADGAACAASLPGVVANAPVKVTDPQGHEIAVGYLGDGLIARASSGNSCDFPFSIPAVPGGVASYGLSVAGHPAQSFAAKDLREDQQAVIALQPAPSPSPVSG